MSKKNRKKVTLVNNRPYRVRFYDHWQGRVDPGDPIRVGEAFIFELRGRFFGRQGPYVMFSVRDTTDETGKLVGYHQFAVVASAILEVEALPVAKRNRRV